MDLATKLLLVEERVAGLRRAADRERLARGGQGTAGTRLPGEPGVDAGHGKTLGHRCEN